MAVGDNFNPRTVKAYDWALFSHECKMPARLVAKTLKTVATDCQKRLQTIANEVKKQGGDDAMVDKVSAIVLAQCQTALFCADEIPKINADYF
jgi:serine/threonine-protein kinase HipA